MTSLPNIFDQVDVKIAELQALLPLKHEDQQRLDKKFRLEFNYNSNHLEGNTLTYGETELLLIFDKTKGEHDKREYDEMSGHDVALHMIQEEAPDAERPLTEQFIRLLNEQILVRPFWKEAITPDGQATRKKIIPGQYKSTPNSVRLQNGEIFNYSSPEDTRIQMPELVAWYNENSKTEHPLLLAALLHYRFVCIHPFDDGNGRIARLLMNYALLKNNLPMVVIKSDEKRAYLNALNRADVGEIDVFVNYLGEQLLWSLDLTIKAAKGNDLEETDDWKKEIELIKRKVADKGEVGKSPQIIYELFNNFDKKVWPAIKDALKKFDGLFSESKTFRYINSSYKPVDEKRSLFDAISIAATDTILGYDPYHEIINKISWEEKKYALKGAKILIDYEIRLNIEFYDYKYIIQLNVKNTNMFILEKTYDDFILNAEINELNKKLKSFLIEQIKKDTNNN